MYIRVKPTHIASLAIIYALLNIREGGGYSVCQGIRIGSAEKIPLFQPPWYDKRPLFFSMVRQNNDPYVSIYMVYNYARFWSLILSLYFLFM